MPSIFGIAARLPVAITKFLARSFCPSTSISCGERKCASPRKTSTPERLEAFLRIVRRDFGAAFPHSLENFFESELRRLSIQAPFFRFADLLDQSRGGNERLARNATEVQAIAAHQTPLNQRDASTAASRSRSRPEPRPAGADHDDMLSA